VLCDLDRLVKQVETPKTSEAAPATSSGSRMPLSFAYSFFGNNQPTDLTPSHETWLRGPSSLKFQFADDLRFVRFHLAGERIGDEVNHVLPRDHTSPWLGARTSRKVSSRTTVVFAREEKQLYWHTPYCRNARYISLD
jgi:hypothetical protein